jgi:YVTN family beta-propeller protein
MGHNRRRRLFAILLMGCLLAATGRAQYVEDSIDVGAGWVGSLAYNSREDVIYGESESQGILFAISCDDNSLVAAHQLMGALELVYDSADNKAWCSYDGLGQESLAVIDGATHSIVKRIEMPGATIPVWDVVSDRVYVSCQRTNSVAVVDAKSDSLLTYVPVGACPIKMYINTLRRKLYVLNYDAGTVSIVSVTTNQVIKTVVVGGTPNAGYYSRSADKFYSAGPHDQCVVIGGQSDTIVARISLPGIEDILGATGNEDAGLVYLGTFTGQDDYVATVLAERDSVIATAWTGREPWGLAYSSQSGLVYCASSWSDEVYVLSGDGARILRTLQVGDYPFVFAFAPRHRRLYLGHLGSRYVYVLSDTAGAIAEPQSPRPELCGVSVTPNPFTQSVAIVWNSFTKGGDVARVYAQDGRLVRQARMPAGEARWVWDGRDGSGFAAPPGVYVVEARVGVRTKIVKLK